MRNIARQMLLTDRSVRFARARPEKIPDSYWVFATCIFSWCKLAYTSADIRKNNLREAGFTFNDVLTRDDPDITSYSRDNSSRIG